MLYYNKDLFKTEALGRRVGNTLIRKINKRHWTLILLVTFAIILFYFILPISIPLILAFLTALLLNPIVRIVQKKVKINRNITVIIVFLLFLLSAGFIGTIIITKAVAQVVNFVADIPSHFNQINIIYELWVADFQQYTQTLPPEFVKQLTISLQENINALSAIIKEKITLDNIAQLFAKIPQYLISFIVYIMALFLFMLEMPALKIKTYNLLTEQTAKKVTFMTKRLSEVLLGFLKAQLFLSIIIFITSLIGLLIIAPEIALIMALVIWVIDLIPILGSIIILGPWAMYMFLSGDSTMGLKLTALAILLLAMRRIIEPKIMGKNLGLSALVTLISMFLGLKLLGIMGFFLGPLIVILFNSAKEADIIKWKIKI